MKISRLVPTDHTKIGTHEIYWDGFDDNGIYDSTRFNGKTLKAKVTGKLNGKQKSAKIEFSTKYHCVDWTDVKINRNTKRVDVTLRVNLILGEISKDVSKTFSDLVNFAQDGLKKYWGRNKTRTVGNNIKINTLEYEIFINPINVDTKSMPALKVFASTENYGRSRNWWGSRKLFYNDGYHYSFYNKNDLSMSIENGKIEDEKEYMHTAPHEIGHEILQAFGGKNNYSYIFIKVLRLYLLKM